MNHIRKDYPIRPEGCKCAEMECSALAAAAQFRGVKFAQLLYSGDIILKNDSWDERGWQRNVSAREKLFLLSLEQKGTSIHCIAPLYKSNVATA